MNRHNNSNEEIPPPLPKSNPPIISLNVAPNIDANFRTSSPTSADPEICQILATDVPFDEATSLIRIETDLTLDNNETEKEIGTSSPRLLQVIKSFLTYILDSFPEVLKIFVVNFSRPNYLNEGGLR